MRTTHLLPVLLITIISISAIPGGWHKDVVDYLQCQVCHTPELSGDVDDSCCNYETVDKAGGEYFHPILQEMTKLTFFRYFKVNLGKSCPFWGDDGMCSSPECAVCECPDEEVPKAWYQKEQKQKQGKTISASEESSCTDQIGEGELSKVDRANAHVGKSFNPWKEEANELIWTSQDNDPEEDKSYINLLENPERFTGYSGYQAERIWQAIYKDNCFKPAPGREKDLEGMCLEERVYYRLISGIQASINTHIAIEYKFGDGSWGTNTELYVDRVGKFSERLENLYFTYLFVMRAIGKAHQVLLKHDFTTGNVEDDKRVMVLMRKLVGIDPASSDCPVEGQAVLKGFDENALFRVNTDGMTKEEAGRARKQKHGLEVEFRSRFQNITRIMDCVFCEKCRLWGKIQITGIGTAIKIILAEPDEIPALERNEVITLIWVLTRLAESVDAVRQFRELELTEAVRHFEFMILGATTIVVIIIVVHVCTRLVRNRRRKQKQA